MSLILQFPTNVELDVLVQEYTAEREKFIGEKILPFEPFMSSKVRWDERDTSRGMTAPHSMDSDPRIDKRPGSKTREYEPIPFKESDLIKESEILRSRELGTFGGVMNIDRAVTQVMKERMDKSYIRAEWLRWKAMSEGEITINENGVFVQETFPIQVYNPLVALTDHANATTLKDRNAIKLLFRRTGASAKGAVEYMNQTTFNHILENTNANDIRGFRAENFADVTFDITNVNKMLEKRGLPTIEIYDEGYVDEADDYQNFIADGNSVIVGKRPAGQKIGAVGMTPTLHRSKNGQPGPGFFSILEVNGQPNMGLAQVTTDTLGGVANPNIKHTGGFYGGPLFWYPRSIIRVKNY